MILEVFELLRPHLHESGFSDKHTEINPCRYCLHEAVRSHGQIKEMAHR